MIEDIKKDCDIRMHKSIDTLKTELAKIRTGRAHVSILDHVTVEYYGGMVPLSQVAKLSADDARTLSVVPWEKDMVAKVEKAIMTSDLGLNPSTSGMTIRVPMPALTEDRRRELGKIVRHEGENAKVAVRNIRRDANNDLKSLLKEKDISEDEERRGQDLIQKLTDSCVAEIDRIVAEKEKELMEV
ncbi:ribosome recycling factor [Halothiobacillus diazotrophicus]|uniref:Ribosome-recycling factor n=1 Tax=Halothiobacillus diazotrophicus TaxID=1860122 RepID=A0A191ZE02_9GAMM|nr:ribosome recycling factor [Halothiobacillus diazotrophicus]ANJ66098.1 ribosome recycling factor [Halothiobacillus diazotrophicus]